MSRSIIRTVSLDSQTVEIASRIPNFSRWIRGQLRGRDQGLDLTDEIKLRIKWVKASRLMAEMIAGQNDEYQNADEVIADFLKVVENQKSLEDFE